MISTTASSSLSERGICNSKAICPQEWPSYPPPPRWQSLGVQNPESSGTSRYQAADRPWLLAQGSPCVSFLKTCTQNLPPFTRGLYPKRQRLQPCVSRQVCVEHIGTTVPTKTPSMFLLQNGNIASTHYRTSSLVTSTQLMKPGGRLPKKHRTPHAELADPEMESASSCLSYLSSSRSQSSLRVPGRTER